MPAIWTASEARRADARARERGIDPAWLMEAAGAAVADALQSLGARRVLILAGPGQNGGDGWVAARRLATRGVRVAVWAPAGGNEVLARAARAVGAVAVERPGSAAVRCDWSVDALFGTGLNRPVGDPWQRGLDELRDSGCPVLAVDVCSGLEADTGRLLGRPVPARLTVTFQALKPAHLLDPGAAMSGSVRVADIGLLAAPGRHFALIDPGAFRWESLERPAGANKYDRGRVLVVGGSRNYGGAPVLAALGALKAGAGYVEMIAPPSQGRGLSALEMLPLVVLPGREGDDGRLVADAVLEEALARSRAVVLGPGLTPADADLVHRVAAQGLPTVVDAGAMTAWARSGRWPWALSVFTPHAGEAARVLDQSIEWIAGHRPEAVRRLARETGGCAVLKGRHTLVAEGGRTPVGINLAGGAELATAGTGDVLAGVIGFLLGAGWPGAQAARAAVLWHGLAGELARQDRGQLSVTAVDVAEHLGPAWQRLCQGMRPADWPEGDA